jgi:hypothetical protein
VNCSLTDLKDITLTSNFLQEENRVGLVLMNLKGKCNGMYSYLEGTDTWNMTFANVSLDLLFSLD